MNVFKQVVLILLCQGLGQLSSSFGASQQHWSLPDKKLFSDPARVLDPPQSDALQHINTNLGTVNPEQYITEATKSSKLSNVTQILKTTRYQKESSTERPANKERPVKTKAQLNYVTGSHQGGTTVGPSRHPHHSVKQKYSIENANHSLNYENSPLDTNYSINKEQNNNNDLYNYSDFSNDELYNQNIENSYDGYFDSVICFYNIEENTSLQICVPELDAEVDQVPTNKLYSHIKNSLYNDSYYFTLSDLCYLTYLDIHNESFQGTLIEMEYNSTYIITDVDITKICLPIFQIFTHCQNETFTIKCLDGNNTMVFLRDHCCQKPSTHDSFFEVMLAFAASNKDDYCFQKICNGEYRIVELQVERISVFLFSLSIENCCYISHMYMDKLLEKYGTVYISYNAYWPCCYANYDVVWTKNPESAGLVRQWSYLPLKCRIGEITIVLIMALVATVGVLGNLLVVTVMLKGGHRDEPSCFLRTSLSVTDLLMSALVATPAVYNACDLMTEMKNATVYFNDEVNSSTWKDTEKFRGYFNQYVNSSTSNYYEHFRYSDSWFTVLQGQVLCFCLTVSITTMFFLSLERFMLTKEPLQYRRYVTLPRIKFVIVSTWIFGFISVFSLALKCYTSIVYWNSWTKFSFGFRGDPSQGYKHFIVIFLILCILSVSTVLFSILSLKNAFKEQARQRAELRSLGMRVTSNYDKENIYISISLIIITSVCMLTLVPPAVINILEYDQNIIDTKFPIMLFISWWLFLAGSSYNPIAYNIRSQQFRSDVAECLQDILPKCWKDRMNPYVTHSKNKMAKYLKALDEKAAKKGITHNGLPEGSKLNKMGLGFVNESQMNG